MLKELLTVARALLAQGWTQGVFARDASGAEVPWAGERATCFCILGAINRARTEIGGSFSLGVLATNVLRARVGSLPDFNDHATHEQVLALFDEAIASC